MDLAKRLEEKAKQLFSNFLNSGKRSRVSYVTVDQWRRTGFEPGLGHLGHLAGTSVTSRVARSASTAAAAILPRSCVRVCRGPASPCAGVGVRGDFLSPCKLAQFVTDHSGVQSGCSVAVFQPARGPVSARVSVQMMPVSSPTEQFKPMD